MLYLYQANTVYLVIIVISNILAPILTNFIYARIYIVKYGGKGVSIDQLFGFSTNLRTPKSYSHLSVEILHSTTGKIRDVMPIGRSKRSPHKHIQHIEY